MKVLFIGASGFIGRHTMAHAIAMKHHFYGTQNKSVTNSLINFNLETDKIADLLPSAFKYSSDPVFGIIGAAITTIDLCAREKGYTTVINVDKTIQLIDDLVKFGITPVFLSTSYVFDGTNGPYTELSRVSPICEYGRQKQKVEEYIANKYNDALILRFDKIVGDNPDEQHLFSEWFRLARAKKPIQCIYRQMMSPTFVTDIAKAIVIACQQSLKGIYHIANNEFISRAELARLFLSITGLATDVIEKPMEAFGFLEPRPLNSCLVSSQFINKSGMQFTKLGEGLTSFAKQIH